MACYTTLPTFRDKLSVPFSRVKNAKKWLGKEFPIHAVWQHTRTQISCITLFICAEIRRCLDESQPEFDKLKMHPTCSFKANFSTNFPKGPRLFRCSPFIRLADQNCVCISCVPRVKGKAVPLQAWTGPEGSRKLGFPDFVTSAQDGGKVVRLTHRPHLPLRNTPGTLFC